MNPPSSARPGFFGGLESLRGLAALYVMLFHLTPLLKSPALSNNFIKNGYLMVDLFFVLSGFVICHTYGAKINSGKEIVRFMFLRFGRLYPLHLATLLLFLGVETAKYVGEVKYGMVPHETRAFSFSNAPAFVANLFLVQPFLPFANLTFNHPSWSIGTEFYTYVIFALVIYFSPNRTSIRLLAAAIIALAVFLLCFYHSYYLSPQAGLSFLRCVLGFFTGLLAYEAFLTGGWISKGSDPVGLGLVFILTAILCFKHPQCVGWDYSVLPVFALLIIVVAGSTAGLISNVLNSSPLRWLGKVSYSIYMVHLFVEMIVSRLYAPSVTLLAKFTKSFMSVHTLGLYLGFFFILLTIFLVLVLSQFTYQWIELPFQKKFRDMAGAGFSKKPRPESTSLNTERPPGEAGI